MIINKFFISFISLVSMKISSITTLNHHMYLEIIETNKLELMSHRLNKFYIFIASQKKI